MQTEIHFLNNRIKGSIVLIVIGVASEVLLHFSFPCIFKTLTSIPCPACGMTRALKLIIKGKVIESLTYNILALPMFTLVLLIIIMSIYQIITNKNVYDMIYDKLDKYKILILFLVLFCWVINIIRKI